MSSRIVHADMDSFFVSVEILKNPALRGKPVVVGDPGPRGVVASASYAARTFGIHSAMPSAEARRLCPQLIFICGDHGAYGHWSARVREVLESYAPRVDAASIDEFYLDLGGCERLHGNFFALTTKIFHAIKDGLGLPISMGLAGNRTLAKIASKVAKPAGIFEVLEGGEELFMAPLPVKLIPGVGPAMQQSLARLGVRTAGELATIPPKLLEKVFGSWGLALHLKARGLWRGAWTAEDEAPRSIGHETTFREDTVDPLFLETALFRLVEKSAVRLRRQGLETGRVTLKVRYSDFSTVTRATRLEPTDLEKEINAATIPLLRALLERRMRVRLVGVSLSNLRLSGWQRNLFREDGFRAREACRCLDRVKGRFGFAALRWATGSIGRGGSPVAGES